jgi:benzoate-CoA ligase family protein
MSYLSRINWGNVVSYYVDRHLDEGRANKTAFRYQGQNISYSDLHLNVQKAARVFRDAGVDYQDRVVLILPDCPNFVFAFFGLISIGAVPVPLSNRLALNDYLYVLADCRPKAAVVTCDLLSTFEQMRERLAEEHLPFPKFTWVIENCAVDAGHESFEQALTHAEPKSPNCRTSLDDMAVIQYTSGSTGVPKGVVHLHRGLLHVPANIVARLGINEDDVLLSTAKVSFGYGLGNSILFPLSCGASAVLFPKLADPYNVCEIIKQSHPTVFFGVPSLYSSILTVPRCETEFNFNGVRVCVSAGERLSPTLFEKWKSVFGHEIVDGIGATECLHIFICSEKGRIKPGSTGKPITGVEVKLVNEEGRSVTAGETGSLHVKAAFNGARYWNKQEETAKTMVGPWTRTGDLLYQDADGYFFHVGREDDVLKIGGLKVSPIEIEECLLTHESVKECAVVSMTQADGTTSIAAYICLRDHHQPSKALEQKLKRFMRGSLSAYKVPRVISFVKELPRTTTGKIARYKLRAG